MSRITNVGKGPTASASEKRLQSKQYGIDLRPISKKTDGDCHLCGGKAPLKKYGSPAKYGGKATTVDHLIPRKHGGTNDPGNLLLAHASCNSSRGTKPVRASRIQKKGSPGKPLSREAKLALALATALLAGWVAGKAAAKAEQRKNPKPKPKKLDWAWAGGTAASVFGAYLLYRYLTK